MGISTLAVRREGANYVLDCDTAYRETSWHATNMARRSPEMCRRSSSFQCRDIACVRATLPCPHGERRCVSHVMVR